MKILHLGKYYPPFYGGIENFMCSLMEQQKKEGHQVSAIVHHHIKKRIFIKECINEINVYRVPIWGQLLYTPVSPSFGYYLQKIIKIEKPDLIHIHTPNLSAFWCLTFPCARETPWVIQWQSDVVGAVPDLKIKILYPFYRFFEKSLLKNARKIIVATPPYAQTSKPLEKFENKVEVVPLALPTNSLAGFNRQKPNKVGSEVNLLMIGRLTYYKGHSVIIEAVEKLKKKGFYFHLNIVGQGELKPEIELQIQQLQLEEHVTLLGNLSDKDLTEELNNTDLLCLPSIERTEAFGIVLLEAMQASKPCLVTDVDGSGMSWVVQDGKTGFVVKYNDVDSLVGKLCFIARNTELLAIYGEVGRKRFDEVFNIKSVSHEITSLYHEVLSNCDSNKRHTN